MSTQIYIYLTDTSRYVMFWPTFTHISISDSHKHWRISRQHSTVTNQTLQVNCCLSFINSPKHSLCLCSYSFRQEDMFQGFLSGAGVRRSEGGALLHLCFSLRLHHRLIRGEPHGRLVWGTQGLILSSDIQPLFLEKQTSAQSSVTSSWIRFRSCWSGVRL